MKLDFSFIVPVYNRPEEIDELLGSLRLQYDDIPFEVVIVEDGSTIGCEDVIKRYQDIRISYYYKENTGPGDSRNYGMCRAKGNYFIILDSDVLLPAEYLRNVKTSLEKNFVNCFGGADTAHPSFTNLQKAINYSMTSFLTTGGIRGNKKSLQKFEPRSFNLGLSKEAFIASGGFGKIHPGEDPDLVIRLWKMGYKTRLIEEAYVYHKRRVSWFKFYQQVSKFGRVRPILNSWHPESKKITFWLPTLFLLGLIISLLFTIIFDSYILLGIYALYFATIFIHSFYVTKSSSISSKAVVASFVQLVVYGYNFLISSIKLSFIRKSEKDLFPELFFN